MGPDICVPCGEEGIVNIRAGAIILKDGRFLTAENDRAGEYYSVGRRILVLGCSGSGKSTFAVKLAKITGLPLTHLDRIWWRPDRTHISREVFDERLAALLREDEWILDGDYSRTYEPRIRACDTAVFLDLDEAECLQGIAERVGKPRPDMPWTEDTVDPELVEMAKKYRTENRPVLMELLKKYLPQRVIVFRSREEAAAWLEGLAAACRRENLAPRADSL